MSLMPENLLHPLAEAEIASLKDAGIAPTLDETIWLNDLARKVDQPGARSEIPAGRPVRLGSQWLWPFTVAASCWYTEAVTWFDGDGELEHAVLAYALAHGRQQGAFDELSDYRTAKERVRAWWKCIDCTVGELNMAVAEVLKDDNQDLRPKEDDGDTSGGGYEELVQWLTAKVHGDPDVWMRQVSQRYCLKMIDVICQQHEASEGVKDPNDPCIVAQRNLGIAAIEIRKRHNG